MNQQASISVAISAHDEEDVIRGALESVARFATEIVVVDSGSSDRTASIAAEYGRVIHETNKLMLNVNKNVAIDATTCEWVLVLDPDERVSPELAAELTAVAAGGTDHAGYWMPRRTIELGRWIQRMGLYPDHQLRFFRRGAARFPCRHIHEMVSLEGGAGYLTGDLLHLPDQDLRDYVHKRNLYSEHRAAFLFEQGFPFRLHRLLGRPVWAFAKQYLLRGGWREGVPGLIIAVSGAYGTFLQDAKLWQRWQREVAKGHTDREEAPHHRGLSTDMRATPPRSTTAPVRVGHDERTATPQVAVEHYAWLAYNDRPRWGSYWHQIHEVLRPQPGSCLIVGKGESTIEDALEHAGVAVTTCDIDPALDPDVVGDVRALPFEDASFDVVLCAQVLEHLEFEAFPRCLRELRRVSRDRVVLSLPRTGRSWELTLRVPFLPQLHVGGRFWARTRHRFDGQHYWELGARDYPRRAVEREIRAVFAIEREFPVPDNAYHYFYVLRPANKSG